MRMDANDVKQRAAGRWREILAALGGIDAGILDGKKHPCPRCGGRDRFRLIDGDAGALFCNQCFNKGNGDGLAALQWLRGWDFQATLAEVARYLGGEPAPDGKARVVKTYDYVDEQAKLLYQVVRYEAKDFRQRRPKDGGGWTWSVKGVRMVPYRLLDLMAAGPERGVLILEGEKDVDRAAGIGIIATTNAMGAGKWRPEYNEHFRGRRVYIIPDNDKPGRDHAQQVAMNLYGIAKSVKVVELPGVPEKADLSVWLDQGGTKEKLAELVKAAPEWKPAPSDKQATPAAPKKPEPPPYIPFPTGVLPVARPSTALGFALTTLAIISAAILLISS